MLTILIFSLATYRLALMLSSDTGPYAMFTKLRAWLKKRSQGKSGVEEVENAYRNHLPKMQQCLVSVPMGVYLHTFKYFNKTVVGICDCFIFIMALSSLAILFNRMFPKR